MAVQPKKKNPFEKTRADKEGKAREGSRMDKMHDKKQMPKKPGRTRMC
jgi:hypothetical protein